MTETTTHRILHCQVGGSGEIIFVEMFPLDFSTKHQVYDSLELPTIGDTTQSTFTAKRVLLVTSFTPTETKLLSGTFKRDQLLVKIFVI